MKMDSSLCDTCQRIKLDDYFSNPDYCGSVELGPFQDIAQRTQCPLCRLVIQALNVHRNILWKDGIYPVEVCYLGRQNTQSHARGLQVWFNYTSDTLPRRIPGYGTTLAEIIPHCQSQTIAHTSSDAGTISRAQLLGEMADIPRIRGWISRCAMTHGPKCNPPDPRPSEEPDLKLLLVDVQNMKLVESAWDSEYIALSYVWGQSKSLGCTKTNISRLRVDGSLRELRNELPRSINDAIELVYSIGERYLWVDALCIIQDDANSKGFYISRMDRIYSNARVTLVTLTSDSVECALPGVSSPRNLIQTPVEINGLHLVQELLKLSAVERHSAWSGRAWTFQERVLSRRLLYFAEHQVFWQCQYAYQSEDCSDHGEHDTPTLGPGSLSNAMLHERRHIPHVQFLVYGQLVQQYAYRNLTFPDDALNAFSGVLSSLMKLYDWNFVCALPESFIDMALLWQAQAGIFRPRWSSKQRRELCGALPSWCWTAWEGHIYWNSQRLVSFAGQKVSIKSEINCFWISDTTGIRQIRTNKTSDHDISIVGQIAEERKLLPYSLIFEAKTIDIEAYGVSRPHLKQTNLRNDEGADGVKSRRLQFIRHSKYSVWIYDVDGQHCGTLHQFDAASKKTLDEKTYRHDLIMLSKSTQGQVTAADFQIYRNHLTEEYSSERDYYEEIFDTHHYCYKSEWAINVMLVRWKDGFAERVSAGQMHVDAWNESLQKSTVITLI